MWSDAKLVPVKRFLSIDSTERKGPAYTCLAEVVLNEGLEVRGLTLKSE